MIYFQILPQTDQFTTVNLNVNDVHDDLFSAFSGGGQSGSGPMAGMAGMGLGALPMSPALVAAALNQAGWGLIGNLGGGPGQGGAPGPPGTQPGDHGGFPTPTSFPATVAPGPTTVANSGTSNGSPAAPGFLGWGASPGAGAEAGPGRGSHNKPHPPSMAQLLQLPRLLGLGQTSLETDKVM